jgi:hypothetical protein
VYIYHRDVSGAWINAPAYVKASNTGVGFGAGITLGDYFGASVSLSNDGNTLAVGAYEEDSAATGINGDRVNDCDADATIQQNCTIDSGAVYLY